MESEKVQCTLEKGINLIKQVDLLDSSQHNAHNISYKDDLNLNTAYFCKRIKVCKPLNRYNLSIVYE